MATRVAPLIRVLIIVFSPVVMVVRALVRGLLRIFGVHAAADANILAVREEIAGALQIGHAEGVVEKEDRDRILGALDLGVRTVDEIMRHRSTIQMIDAGLPVTEILRLVLDSPHTRHPLWKEAPKNIVGLLHAKDLLRAMQRMLRDDGRIDLMNWPPSTSSTSRWPLFHPDTTTLDDQMRAFLKRKSHFALVVDEYGALQGLITLEDILEEIVGEIADEFDVPTEDPVAATPDGAYIVPGLMTIRDLNRQHDWTADDEANTVAGLVIHEAQMIPTQGQVFSFHGFRFEVLEKQDNRIATLKIKPSDAKPPGREGGKITAKITLRDTFRRGTILQAREQGRISDAVRRQEDLGRHPPVRLQGKRRRRGLQILGRSLQVDGRHRG